MTSQAPGATRQRGWWERWGRSYLPPILLIVVVGAALRLWQIDVLPPGLSLDEAAEGIDARAILSGAHPIFLPSNNGREPFFAYVVAAVMAVFGPGIPSIRIAAAILGILSLPAFYLCLRALAGPRVGFLGAFALAISPWHLHLSRLGFRTVAEPLFAALAVWLVIRALRGRRYLDWAFAGLAVGAGIYTYLPARLFAPVLALLPVLWVTMNWSRERRHLRRHAAGFVLLVTVAFAVFAPLGAYFWRHPADFMGRTDQVSVGNAIRAGAEPAQVLLRTTRDTLLMFVLEGDSCSRHNLPGKPVFDLFLVGPFLLGLVLSLSRLRRSGDERDGQSQNASSPEDPDGAGGAGIALCWIWMAVMILPGILSDSTPHALRTAGMLPATHLFVGLGLAAVWGWLSRLRIPPLRVSAVQWQKVAPVVVVGGLLAVSAGLTASDYFRVWARQPRTWEQFEGDKVVAARIVNDLPTNTLALIGPVERDNYTLSFMLQTQAEVRLFGWDTFPLVEPAGRDVVYVVLANPVESRARLSAYYPGGSQSRSALTSSLSKEAFVWKASAGSARGDPPAPGVRVQRRLGGFIDLIGYDIDSTATVGDNVNLRLYWKVVQRPPKDYVTFIHLIGPDGTAWAQRDDEPGGGASPTSSWSEGDLVIDERRFSIPPGAVPDAYKVVVGLYERDGGQRLEVRDEQGRALGNQISLGTVQVAKSDRRFSPSLLSIPKQSSAIFVGGESERLRLLGFGLGVDQVKAGESLGVLLFWQSLTNLSGDYSVQLQVLGADGSELGSRSERPVLGRYSTRGWAEGEIVRDPHRLLISAATPPGRYSVRLRVVTLDGSGLHVEGREDEGVDLGQIEVLPAPATAMVGSAPPGHPVQADLGGVIRFLGYDLDASQRQPGQPVTVRLHWQALGPIDTSYTVFVHLLDSQEKVWGQKDSVPKDGALPTTAWMPDQRIVDTYEFAVDPAAPPGRYSIEIGMYDATTGARLPITDPQGNALGDRLLFDQVDVIP